MLSTKSETQKVHLQSPWNLDLVGIIVGEKDSLALVFKIRNGKIIAKDTIWLNRPTGQEEAELMGQFLRRYYTDNTDIPGNWWSTHCPPNRNCWKNGSKA